MRDRQHVGSWIGQPGTTGQKKGRRTAVMRGLTTAFVGDLLITQDRLYGPATLLSPALFTLTYEPRRTTVMKLHPIYGRFVVARL